MNVYFDLDDTLIQTQKLYDETKEEIIKEILKEYPFLFGKEIRETFKEIESKNIKKYGLSSKGFPSSWMETYEVFSSKSDKKEWKKKKETIYQMASEVFERKPDLYPNSIQVLKEIKKLGYELNLLTVGDAYIQNKRIDDVGLRAYFDHIYILPEKAVESIKKIMKNKNPSHCIMVGNSLKSDIYPSIEIGMNAIHVEENTWAYDHNEVDKTNNRYHVCTLKEVPQVIKNLTV